MKKKSYILGITVVILWSTAASAFKISLKYLNFLQLLFYSILFSDIFFFTLILLKKEFKEMNIRKNINSIFLGFLNPFLYYLILFKSYSMLKGQVALCLNYTWPIWIVIFSAIILKSKINLVNVFAILMSYFGVFIIFTNLDFKNFNIYNSFGSILAMSTAIIWGIYWILNVKDKRKDEIKLFYNFFFSIIYFFIFLIFFKIDIRIKLLYVIGPLYISLFEMGLTFFLWIKALKYSENTSRIANLIFLSPFLSLFLLSIFAGEKILTTTILGLIFIISGILINEFFLTKRKFRL